MSGPGHPRGTSNSNSRGSVEQRKKRKQWLLDEFGDGTFVDCAFAGCGLVLDWGTVTIDRFPVAGRDGGKYVQGNIRPACGPCNSKDGNLLRDGKKVMASRRRCAICCDFAGTAISPTSTALCPDCEDELIGWLMLVCGWGVPLENNLLERRWLHG